VHGLNKALAKKGVDVTVYTTNAGLSEKVPANSEVDVNGIKVVYFRLTKFFNFSGLTNWQFSVEMTKALSGNISKFDVICINGLWSYPAAISCYYSWRYRKPYIIAPRGMLYRYTMGRKAWKKWPYYQLISKKHMQCASAIHYTTRDEAEQCHSRLRLNNTALIIPNGVDASMCAHLSNGEKLKSRYPVLEGKKVILFMSRICWIKGLDILTKAFGLIARNREDIHLLIVGPDEGGYEKKVKGWLEEEGVQDKATFTGMLKGDEKLDAFAGSDLFVLPSYSENFGMVVVEAMTCGLPVVISDQVGICDDVEKAKAGIIIETDAKQLAEALTRLLDNTNLRSEMGGQGKALAANKYSWEQIAGSMLNAFEELRKTSKREGKG
jgi:glycosyltransferase involved in cell wall biosynthesis